MVACCRLVFTVSFISLLLASSCLSQVDSVGASGALLSRDDFSVDSVYTLPSQEFVPQWYDMFANIPHDWVRWGGATFTTRNIPLILGLTVTTVALVAVDDATWKASDKWYRGSRIVEKASDICEMFGDGKTQFGLAAAFGLYGFAARDGRALRTASQTVEVILACGTVVQVLKHMTGRESPFVSTAPGGKWRLLPNQIEYHKHVPNYDAYPSGHVATALATVTVIAENYSEVGWIRPVGYTLVGLLAVAMGNTGIHWYSDYPLGLALGYSFGMLVAHPHETDLGDNGNEQGAKLSLSPMMSQTGGGIRIAMSF
jgi:membrane-associated PAP2 superfamily phosphatase